MSEVTFLKIKRIVRKEAKPVYDIQIKKNHNFFANGLLVHNCLIFQEQVMLLAEKCAGFPKEQCDEVRRAIMKRSISGGAAAQKVAQETRGSFVEGCVKNEYSEQIANGLYDKILFFAGYSFNKSHAVAYAIDSFWCAWLMTYHEEEWLTAYVESMLGNPEKKAKAFGEIRQLGYTIVPVDINLAEEGWRVLPGKRFMPSLSSNKGIGDSAAEEIVKSRPYTSIEDMLWNEDGTWRPSKFNKRALETLIKTGAFESLNCVGEGKIFNSYHHMHEVLIENADAVKKSSKKDPQLGRKTFYELARALAPEMEEWTRREWAQNKIEAFGSFDVATMIDPAILDKLDKKGVNSIDFLEQGETKIAWFVITTSTKKQTKTGKEYVMASVMGVSGKQFRLNVWGAKELYEDYSLCFAEVKKDDYGCSTTSWKIKTIR